MHTDSATSRQETRKLEYAVVVATRNRVDMLAESLPRFIGQTRPPARIVVVDSSEDPDAVRSLCGALASETSVPVEVLHSDVANSSAQRNQGLERVAEPVVVFPDDDSLWFSDSAEQLLRVYEADVNERYGAVSLTPEEAAPTDIAASAPPRQRRLGTHPLVARARNAIGGTLTPQPFNRFGIQQTELLEAGAVRDGLNHPLVPSIGGYRMSFRTDIVRKLGFDDVLGSRIGYAIHEDMDLGMRVLAAGYLIAAAPSSRVFHSTYPGERADGFNYGFFHVFNYAYICRKVFPKGSRLLRQTRRYLAYKVGLYGLRALLRPDAHHREVYLGARAAYAEIPAILRTRADELAGAYAEVSGRHLR